MPPLDGIASLFAAARSIRPALAPPRSRPLAHSPSQLAPTRTPSQVQHPADTDNGGGDSQQPSWPASSAGPESRLRSRPARRARPASARHLGPAQAAAARLAAQRSEGRVGERERERSSRASVRPGPRRARGTRATAGTRMAGERPSCARTDGRAHLGRATGRAAAQRSVVDRDGGAPVY